MLKQFLAFGAVVAVAACQPAIPESGPGAGFDNNLNTLRTSGALRQPAQVETSALPGVAGVAGPVSPGSAPRTGPVDAFAEAERSGPASTIVDADPANSAPRIANDPGISREQDFDAVSSRRSIESDAERIAAIREQYRVIEPGPLPDASEANEPNIIDYALRSTNRVGEAVYTRSILSRTARFQRACATYASADEAQIDFLANGGPQRDRKGVDPDGDGFACNWDPEIYRRIRRE